MKINSTVKKRDLGIINKVHSKCDCLDGSVLNRVRQPILHSFILDKPSGYKVFCEPERIQFQENKSVLKNITIFLADDNHEEVDSNGETLTFTLQMIKIWTIKCDFKNLKAIVTVLVVDTDLLQTNLWR